MEYPYEDDLGIRERVFYDKNGKKESSIWGFLMDDTLITGDLISYHSDGMTPAHRERGTFYHEMLQGSGYCEFYDENGRITDREQGYFYDGRLIKGLRIFYKDGEADSVEDVISDDDEE